MFKKPKRHFRQRKLTDGSDEENSEEPSAINNGQNSGASHQNNNGSKKKKEGGGESRKVKKPIAAVSFEEEGEGIAILSLCHLLYNEFTVNICCVLNRRSYLRQDF